MNQKVHRSGDVTKKKHASTVDAPFRNNDHQQIVFHFPVFYAEEENLYIERLLEFYDQLDADYCVLFDVETNY